MLMPIIIVPTSGMSSTIDIEWRKISKAVSYFFSFICALAMSTRTLAKSDGLNISGNLRAVPNANSKDVTAFSYAFFFINSSPSALDACQSLTGKINKTYFQQYKYVTDKIVAVKEGCYTHMWKSFNINQDFLKYFLVPGFTTAGSCQYQPFWLLTVGLGSGHLTQLTGTSEHFHQVWNCFLSINSEEFVCRLWLLLIIM